MGIKEWIIDLFDPKPINNKVTLYAVGTAIEGIALGLFLAKFYNDLSDIRIVMGLFIIGALIAVSSFSFIKRKCEIKVK